jgi:diguanylate cyclase (GGDEF)-like protein
VPPVTEEDEVLQAVALLGSEGPPPVAGFVPREDESLRLARELRGTIAELLAARQTVDLQRDELERIRTVDPVTGVATRAAILGRLQIEVAEARRYAHPCAFVLIDLDAMAGTNRARGSEVGDAVLRELALRLRLRVREADAIGRTDGDTFLAILPHTDEGGASVFAEAILSRLTARAVETNEGPLTMSVSIGITIIRAGDEVSDAEVLGRAEEALASARAAGGNRIAFDRSHGLARLDARHEDKPEAHAEASEADAQ